jgi:hypothetical protein
MIKSQENFFIPFLNNNNEKFKENNFIKNKEYKEKPIYDINVLSKEKKIYTLKKALKYYIECKYKEKNKFFPKYFQKIENNNKRKTLPKIIKSKSKSNYKLKSIFNTEISNERNLSNIKSLKDKMTQTIDNNNDLNYMDSNNIDISTNNINRNKKEEIKSNRKLFSNFILEKAIIIEKKEKDKINNKNYSYNNSKNKNNIEYSNNIIYNLTTNANKFYSNNNYKIEINNDIYKNSIFKNKKIFNNENKNKMDMEKYLNKDKEKFKFLNILSDNKNKNENKKYKYNNFYKENITLYDNKDKKSNNKNENDNENDNNNYDFESLNEFHKKIFYLSDTDSNDNSQSQSQSYLEIRSTRYTNMKKENVIEKDNLILVKKKLKLNKKENLRDILVEKKEIKCVDFLWKSPIKQIRIIKNSELKNLNSKSANFSNKKSISGKTIYNKKLKFLNLL